MQMVRVLGKNGFFFDNLRCNTHKTSYSPDSCHIRPSGHRNLPSSFWNWPFYFIEAASCLGRLKKRWPVGKGGQYQA